MSEKTNTLLNAYVTGIGKNLRIVLWDTTLARLSQNEVLFVMAHEMGHYDSSFILVINRNNWRFLHWTLYYK
ncbi:M48 family metalloprotease [Anaerobacillus sp. HL2]|nr:M48 family metalloprotease [Anaerobacillus sp. HL2]